MDTDEAWESFIGIRKASAQGYKDTIAAALNDIKTDTANLTKLTNRLLSDQGMLETSAQQAPSPTDDLAGSSDIGGNDMGNDMGNEYGNKNALDDALGIIDEQIQAPQQRADVPPAPAEGGPEEGAEPAPDMEQGAGVPDMEQGMGVPADDGMLPKPEANFSTDCIQFSEKIKKELQKVASEGDYYKARRLIEIITAIDKIIDSDEDPSTVLKSDSMKKSENGSIDKSDEGQTVYRNADMENHLLDETRKTPVSRAYQQQNPSNVDKDGYWVQRVSDTAEEHGLTPDEKNIKEYAYDENRYGPARYGATPGVRALNASENGGRDRTQDEDQVEYGLRKSDEDQPVSRDIDMDDQLLDVSRKTPVSRAYQQQNQSNVDKDGYWVQRVSDTAEEHGLSPNEKKMVEYTRDENKYGPARYGATPEVRALNVSENGGRDRTKDDDQMEYGLRKSEDGQTAEPMPTGKTCSSEGERRSIPVPKVDMEKSDDVAETSEPAEPTADKGMTDATANSTVASSCGVKKSMPAMPSIRDLMSHRQGGEADPYMEFAKSAREAVQYDMDNNESFQKSVSEKSPAFSDLMAKYRKG